MLRPDLLASQSNRFIAKKSFYVKQVKAYVEEVEEQDKEAEAGFKRSSSAMSDVSTSLDHNNRRVRPVLSSVPSMMMDHLDTLTVNPSSRPATYARLMIARTSKSPAALKEEAGDDVLSINLMGERSSQGKLKDKDDEDVRSAAIEDFLELMYPTSECLPSMDDLVHSVVRRPKEDSLMFVNQNWVEYTLNSVTWRLGCITQTIPLKGDDGETVCFYSIANTDTLLDPDQVRAPKDGLIHVFGYRPWLWQQWALLKIENRIRFQAKHERDFAIFDVTSYAFALWDQWLDSPSNADFRAVYDSPRLCKSARGKLIRHVFQPFFTIRDICNPESSHWNIADSEQLSVFNYLSILGSQPGIPLVNVLLQVVIPIIIISKIASAYADDENDLDFTFSSLFCVVESDNTEDTGEVISDAQLASLMVNAIIIIYLTLVAPQRYIGTITWLGYGNPTPYSRMMRLRREVASMNNDTFLQALGHKLDFFMNNAYVCFLYIFNIFSLLQGSEPLDVLLNAVALEFIVNLDEMYANSSFWDPERRILKAGMVELVIDRFLCKTTLRSPDLFAKKFHLSFHELDRACEYDQNLFYDAETARRDREDPQYMDSIDRAYMQTIKIARQTNNRRALRSLVKNDGWSLFKREASFRCPMFSKHEKYQTWSRWEKVLYISQVPKADDLSLSSKDTSKCDSVCELEKDDEIFAKYEHEGDDDFYLNRYTLDVLSFKFLSTALLTDLKQKKVLSMPITFLSGIIHWLLISVMLMFRTYLVAAFVIVPLCTWSHGQILQR